MRRGRLGPSGQAFDHVRPLARADHPEAARLALDRARALQLRAPQLELPVALGELLYLRLLGLGLAVGPDPRHGRLDIEAEHAKEVEQECAASYTIPAPLVRALLQTATGVRAS